MKSIITASEIESRRAEAVAESKKALSAKIARLIVGEMPYKALRTAPTYNRVAVTTEGERVVKPAVIMPSRLTADYINVNLSAAVVVESAFMSLYRESLNYYRALVGAEDKSPSLSKVKAAYYGWARAMIGQGYAGTPVEVRTALHSILRIKSSKAEGHVYELSKVTPAAVESAFWAVLVESSFRVIESKTVTTPAAKAAAAEAAKAKAAAKQADKNAKAAKAKAKAEAAADEAAKAKAEAAAVARRAKSAADKAADKAEAAAKAKTPAAKAKAEAAADKAAKAAVEESAKAAKAKAEAVKADIIAEESAKAADKAEAAAVK